MEIDCILSRPRWKGQFFFLLNSKIPIEEQKHSYVSYSTLWLLKKSPILASMGELGEEAIQNLYTCRQFLNTYLGPGSVVAFNPQKLYEECILQMIKPRVREFTRVQDLSKIMQAAESGLKPACLLQITTVFLYMNAHICSMCFCSLHITCTHPSSYLILYCKDLHFQGSP